MFSQPHSVEDFNYRIRMNPKDSKKVLWDNVSRLMVARYGKENLTRLSQEAGIGPATCTRIKKQTTSVGTDVLEAVAKALKVSAWQLLVAGLDPAKLPVLSTDTRAQETAEYFTVSAAEAAQVLAQTLSSMTAASRESAATLLSSMAKNPDGQWAEWLADLFVKESTFATSVKADRGEIPRGATGVSLPTMGKNPSTLGQGAAALERGRLFGSSEGMHDETDDPRKRGHG